MIRYLSNFFAGRHQYEARLNTLTMENATLRARLVAAGLEKHAALEEAAGERLRNAAKDESIAAGLRALDRSRARVADLEAEIDRKSAMPGDFRYWEGRYRDEAAQADKLRQQVADLQAQVANAERTENEGRS